MNCNGDLENVDNSVICLDASQDSLISDDDGNEINAVIPNCDKTLPPGVAPKGFIILDESSEQNVEDELLLETKDLPMFEIIFKDEAVMRQYQEQVKDFFQQLVTVRWTDDDLSDSKFVMKIWGDSKDNVFNDTENESHVLFTIDNKPGIEKRYNIPTYGKKFERVLKRSYSDSDDESKNDKCTPKMNCFNCLNDHNLRDCPEPRNPVEINKNRKEFTSRSGPRNARYHIDEEQKYKPGVLSAELRKALGLPDDHLPRHILKMRLLGYPPGWLEEAKLEHSGLNLYNSEGNRERDPTEEAGEIFTPENKTQYDVNKLHDFPGFNVPAPPGTRDAFWSVEQQQYHSKENMLMMLGTRKADKGYKRKKLKTTLDDLDPVNVTLPVTMDIEPSEKGKIELIPINGDFASPLPKVPVINSKTELSKSDETTPLSTLTKIDSCDVSLRSNSPSLLDLECKKKLLLEALDDSNSQSNSGTPLKSNVQESIFQTPKSSTGNTLESTPVPSSSVESTPKHGSVKSVELGTPILQNTSIYTKLPPSEKFSKDICDVINFENLPGATGMFNKINGILQKVRDTLNNIEQD